MIISNYRNNVERLSRKVKEFTEGSDPLNPPVNNKIARALSQKMDISPQMDHLWRVELPDLTINNENIRGIYPDSAIPRTSVPMPEELSHRVYSVSIPYNSFESEKNTDGPTFMYTAKHTDIGNLSLTVDEYEDGRTLLYFNYWMALINSSANFAGIGRMNYFNVPAFYKRDIEFIRLNGAKNDIHISRYLGYFPTAINESSFSSDANAVSQLQVTLTGDDVDHIVIPKSDIMMAADANDRAILENSLSLKSNFELAPDAIKRVFDLALDRVLGRV